MQGARWLTGIGVSSDVNNDMALTTTKLLTKSPFFRKGPFKKLGSGDRI